MTFTAKNFIIKNVDKEIFRRKVYIDYCRKVGSYDDMAIERFVNQVRNIYFPSFLTRNLENMKVTTKNFMTKNVTLKIFCQNDHIHF